MIKLERRLNLRKSNVYLCSPNNTKKIVYTDKIESLFVIGTPNQFHNDIEDFQTFRPANEDSFFDRVFFRLADFVWCGWFWINSKLIVCIQVDFEDCRFYKWQMTTSKKLILIGCIRSITESSVGGLIKKRGFGSICSDWIILNQMPIDPTESIAEIVFCNHLRIQSIDAIEALESSK